MPGWYWVKLEHAEGQLGYPPVIAFISKEDIEEGLFDVHTFMQSHPYAIHQCKFAGPLEEPA